MKNNQPTKSQLDGETDLDKLNRFLINLGESNIGIRRKLLILKKFMDITTGEKED